MKKFISFLKQRWVASLFGVLALIALIWFAGPYIGIGDSVPLASATVRLWVIVILVVCWGLNNLRKQVQASRANNQIIDEISDSATMASSDSSGMNQSAEEIALLQQRFEEAMGILKRSRQKDGGGSLYDLPWYIIIGPPGAGKTTALLNSGLKFPLEEQFGTGELKGVGGTRNCDWLFTDQAVLLDTAGRYVTQDSHAQVDSLAWEGFLDLLKKHRRRRPVNGVLVAISLADLMKQDSHERESHVLAIKQRVNELYEHFGIRLPVYVLLTKCDLVAGFTEFFDDLGREERAQVWGLTFPVSDEDDVTDIHNQFESEFSQLLMRLNARLFSRLSQERDLKRRSLIYAFPQQMSSLKASLGQFLAGVFQSNRFEEPIMLRGVYFTSGTQEGRPIDRLMGAVSRTFGLDQQALPGYGGHGRSYFITRLLNEVVFPEAGLAGQNLRLESRRIWLQRGSYAGILVVTVLAILAWFTSYTANKSHVNQLVGSIEEYRQGAGDVDKSLDIGVILARLDGLKIVDGVANQYNNDVPIHMRLWLYQGDALGDASTDAYLREMNNSFAPFLARRLEEQLSSSSNSPEFQYEALKTYLMLGNPQRLEPQHISLWMGQDWQNLYPGDPDSQSRLLLHLDNLLQGAISPVSLDQRLVMEVRKNLQRVPLAELVYGRMKIESNIGGGAFRVVDGIRPMIEEVFLLVSGNDLKDASIPELFTYQGFYQSYKVESQRLVEQTRKEDWVIGDEASELYSEQFQRLEKDIRALYIDDYITVWQGLLSDIEVIPFRDVRHAMHVLEILSGPASPMLSLLESVQRNTALNRLPSGVSDVAKAVGEKAKNKSRFARLLGKAPNIDVSAKTELPGSQVDLHFQSLNRLVQSEQGRSMPADNLIELLSELYGQLATIEGNYPSMGAAANNAAGLRTSLQRLQIAATKLPEPVKGWMQQLTRNSQSVALGNARKQVDVVWKSTMQSACEKALNNRYPFKKDGRFEVTTDDFGRFFGPDGKFDQFYKEQLEPLVDTSVNPWRWRSEGSRVGLSNEALSQFQRASAIRETFFNGGGRTPMVNFALKPIFLDAEVTRFVLDLEGQRFIYRHGPAVVANARWPGQGGSSEVRLVFEDKDGVQATITEDGPWAWFKVLDQADKYIISPDRFTATFSAGDRKARYEVRAHSVFNPFVMQELWGFKCPQGF